MIGSVGNSSQLFSQLFSQLDSKGQGYLEKSDFESAFQSLSGSSSSSGTTSADDVFAALDSNSDGKVTESEFASTLSKLQQELDAQFGQMRMHGGGQGMPPPPPQDAQDTGFTKDQLQSQLEQIGSSDSQRASLISNIVNNFSTADSDGDGKVTRQEAMAFDQSQRSSSTSGITASASSADSSASDSSSSTSSDAQVMFKIMQLLHAYGQQATQSAASQFSVSV